MDAFPSDCSEVSGYLRIEGSSITDLSPLSAITSVGDYFIVQYTTELTSLDGLSTLTYVERLVIANNASLTSLDGLSGVDSMVHLEVVNNDALTTLDGLSRIDSLAETLTIADNDALTSLAGLAGITSVGGVYIGWNDALTSLDGLSAITSAVGSLWLEDNAVLTDVDGLAGITSVEGHVVIADNASLTSLDGLSDISSVGDYLRVQGNASLTSLDGLSAITSVGEDPPCGNEYGCGYGRYDPTASLWIMNNAVLTNVDGLSAITSVGRNLWIGDNDALTSLDGLSRIDSVGRDLSIYGNEALTACTQGLYALISSGGVGGSVLMQGNAPTGDCNNNGDDLAAVGVDAHHEVTLPTAFALIQNYPNPFNPTTTISYALPRSAEATLTVVDVRGSVVREHAFETQPAGTYEVRFDATGLPSGVYFYNLQAGEFAETRRMVVVR